MKHKILNGLMMFFLIASLVVYMIGDLNEGFKATVYTITIFVVLVDLAVYVLQFFAQKSRKE